MIYKNFKEHKRETNDDFLNTVDYKKAIKTILSLKLTYAYLLF